MKNKFFLTLILVSCLAVVAAGCGGSSGTDESNSQGQGSVGNTTPFTLQAKEIAASGIYAAIIANQVGIESVFIKSLEGLPTPQTAKGNISNYPYATITLNKDDNGIADIDFNYILSSEDFLNFTFTVAKEQPVKHEHIITSVFVPAFKIDGTEYAGITYSTAGADKKIIGESFGHIDFKPVSYTAIQMTGVDLTGTGLSVDDLTVKLADGTSGTVDISNWEGKATLSEDGKNIVSTLPASQATVVYQSHTYDCQNLSGTYSDSGGPTSIFTVGTDIQCTCKDC